MKYKFNFLREVTKLFIDNGYYIGDAPHINSSYHQDLQQAFEYDPRSISLGKSIGNIHSIWDFFCGTRPTPKIVLVLEIYDNNEIIIHNKEYLKEIEKILELIEKKYKLNIEYSFGFEKVTWWDYPRWD